MTRSVIRSVIRFRVCSRIRLRFAAFLPAMYGAALVTAHAQIASVLYDPSERMTCIAREEATNCVIQQPPPDMLTVNKQIRLRVVNGQWLTRYVLHWGSEGPSSASFPIVAGGPVQPLALELFGTEPARPSSTAAATKWTASAILSSLLDPGLSAVPESEIGRQSRELIAHKTELRSEIDAFNEIYGRVVTQSGNGCNPVLPRSGFQLAECLKRAYTAPAFPASPVTQQVFLELNQRWRERFDDVQSFAREFNANRIGLRVVDLQTAIGVYRQEAEAYDANRLACSDAFSLVEDMRKKHQASVAALAARVELRAQLATAAGAAASISSSVLDREVLADAEIRALNQTTSLPSIRLEKLNNFCKEMETRPDDFASDLNDLRAKERYLSLLVKSINDMQALVISKLNAMYESTTISPIDAFYSMSFKPQEESISYSVGVVHEFIPYTLTGVAPADGNQGATSPVAHEEIVASGGFAVLPPPSKRKHALTHLLTRVF